MRLFSRFTSLSIALGSSHFGWSCISCFVVFDFTLSSTHYYQILSFTRLHFNFYIWTLFHFRRWDFFRWFDIVLILLIMREWSKWFSWWTRAWWTYFTAFSTFISWFQFSIMTSLSHQLLLGSKDPTISIEWVSLWKVTLWQYFRRNFIFPWSLTASLIQQTTSAFNLRSLEMFVNYFLQLNFRTMNEQIENQWEAINEHSFFFRVTQIIVSKLLDKVAWLDFMWSDLRLLLVRLSLMYF